MGEKNEVKVRLSTVVYLFIILVLVVALGVVYYLGFVKNDNANNIIANGEVTETNNTEKEVETLNKEEKILRPSKKISKLFKNGFEAEQYCLCTQIEEFYEREVSVGDAVDAGTVLATLN